jgi:hypothetical protein
LVAILFECIEFTNVNYHGNQSFGFVMWFCDQKRGPKRFDSKCTAALGPDRTCSVTEHHLSCHWSSQISRWTKSFTRLLDTIELLREILLTPMYSQQTYVHPKAQACLSYSWQQN